MSKDTAFYVAIFATAAMALGFFFAHFRGAAHEAVTRARQAEHALRTRNRLAGRVTLIAVLTAAVLYVIATHHHHR
jgi:amino acid transporter